MWNIYRVKTNKTKDRKSEVRALNYRKYGPTNLVIVLVLCVFSIPLKTWKIYNSYLLHLSILGGLDFLEADDFNQALLAR